MKVLFLIFAFQLVLAEFHVEEARNEFHVEEARNEFHVEEARNEFHVEEARNEFHVKEARNDLSSVVRDLLKKVHEHEKIFTQQNQVISKLESEVKQQNEIIINLKSDVSQQNQVISNLKSEVDTMKKKIETCCSTKKKEIPAGKTKENPVKSCKWLQEDNKDFKSGLYWISLKEPTQVYCDMSKKYGGGWTLIGKATCKSIADIKEVNYYKLLSNSISDLRSARSNRFLLSSRGLKKLQSYIGFTQIRFYCYKPWHGRTIHIHTLENKPGKDVIDLMTERTDKDPQSCGSYARFQDDDSNIGRSCERWDHGKWNNYGEDNVKMYNFPFHINGKHHFSLYPDRLECDDWNNKGIYPAYSSIGEWAFYVR